MIQVHLLSIPDSYDWNDQVFDVVGSFLVDPDSDKAKLTFTELTWAALRDVIPAELTPPGSDFSVHRGAGDLVGKNGQVHAKELASVTDWLDTEGRYRHSTFHVSSSSLSGLSVQESVSEGFLDSADAYFLVPILGRGAVGGFVLELLASNLIWLGVGLLASELRATVPRLYAEHQLTNAAREACRGMESRGVYSVGILRRWASRKESWTTYAGSKQLGVSRDMMEEIFTALGYRLRHSDQVWILSELPEDRIRRQAWIDAEPELLRVETERQAKSWGE